jgi:small subunit ribosomal protein S16
MLTIRLSRIGKKKKPMYRLIISEKNKDPYGDSLEILGSYDPYTKNLQVKKERIEHWLKNGSKMSPTVNNLLIEKGIIEGKKVTASKTGKGKPVPENNKPEEKTEEAEKEKSEEKPEEIKTENPENARADEKKALEENTK